MTHAASAALAVEWWPIDKPVPYARNARVCPESAIAKVAGSLTEFGWRQPIVVDGDGVIIAGHTRLLAAQRLGLEQVPVHIATDLTPQQVKAYRLMDNRSAQESSWDMDLLPLELADLAEFEFDLALTGFEPDELAAILAEETEGLTDPDAVPEPPEEPVSKPGDLYLLGEHRLLCGDATNPDDVQKLMAGKRATLMATDPPYLVDYQGGAHPASEANGGAENKDKNWDTYIDHEHSVEFYVEFLRTALDHALTEDAAIYQWFGIMPIRRPISYHTKPGGLIYEPFSGSGTALIAAEEMGRTCYAMEQAPQFVDVAVARWEAFTGRKAERG